MTLARSANPRDVAFRAASAAAAGDRSTPMPNAAWKLRQCGQQQASGAGAQVQDLLRWRTVKEHGDGRLDERLRLRARDQSGGRYGKLQAPELASTDDQRQRFTCLSPGDQQREANHVRRHPRIAQQRLYRDPMRMGQQQSRFKPWIVDTRPPEPLGAEIDCLLNRVAQTAWLAVRFACARSRRRLSALASTVGRRSGVPSR